MPWPKKSETVEMVVNGRSYRDWESVSITHELYANPSYLATFTCSEGMPLSKNLGVLQIKPGMDVTINLAGFPAFRGKVMTRQVFYDAQRHHIQIICGTNHELLTASVISKTMEWKDKTFKEIAESILSPLGINLKFEGGPPPDHKFKRVSAGHGMTIIDFLDDLGRGLGSHSDMGMAFTTNENADFVVVMGKNGTRDSITEGKDIVTGREVIYNPGASNERPSVGQDTGNDKKWGAAVAHAPFADLAGQSDFSGKQPPGVILFEHPTSEKTLLQSRSTTEEALSVGNQITVTATVYGWLRPSGGLWQRNQEVVVNSPMLIMNGDVLRAKSVTFTQSNHGGTQTTLVLVNPLANKSNPSVAG